MQSEDSEWLLYALDYQSIVGKSIATRVSDLSKQGLWFEFTIAMALERKALIKYEPHSSSFVTLKKVLMNPEKVANSKVRKVDQQRKEKERKEKKVGKPRKNALKVKMVFKKKK